VTASWYEARFRWRYGRPKTLAGSSKSRKAFIVRDSILDDEALDFDPDGPAPFEIQLGRRNPACKAV